MANPAEERAALLQSAIARGKQLKPEHQAEYERYMEMGVIKEPGRAMPNSAAERFEDDVNVYGTFKRARAGFNPDYGGNLFGDIENIGQGLYSGFGTEGQRDWWANFKSADNLIRNKLFGSALTEHEKRAYEATTINPRMDPKEIQRNLTRRNEIITGALARKRNYFKANGYNPKAVDALLGEYAPDFDQGGGRTAPRDNDPLGLRR